MKKFMFLIVFLCMISLVFGGELYGNIYDIELNKAENVVVEIGGQRLLAENGSYSFELSEGEYIIKASKIIDGVVEESAIESVVVKEGENVYDLFLFPDLEEEEINIDLSVVEEEKVDYSLYFKIGYVVLILLIIVLFLIWKKKIKNKKVKVVEEKGEDFEQNDLDKILDIIKKENGRTTQKDIRKEMPYSEAKISLMISELEHKGKIERIKKGRGNIIIFKS